VIRRAGGLVVRTPKEDADGASLRLARPALDGPHARILDAPLVSGCRLRGRLATEELEGREIGKLVEWMTFPYESAAKSFTIIQKAADHDEPVPGYSVVGILWRTKELRDLAKEADLVIDRGVLILRGDEGEPAAKSRFQPARPVGRKVIAT
jgi:hypothetical protein